MNSIINIDVTILKLGKAFVFCGDLTYAILVWVILGMKSMNQEEVIS